MISQWRGFQVFTQHKQWPFKLELLMCAWLEAIIPALSLVPVSCTAAASSQWLAYLSAMQTRHCGLSLRSRRRHSQTGLHRIDLTVAGFHRTHGKGDRPLRFANESVVSSQSAGVNRLKCIVGFFFCVCIHVWPQQEGSMAVWIWRMLL